MFPIDKHTLRTYYRTLRENIPKTQQVHQSLAIHKTLSHQIALPKSLHIYLSIPNEVDTAPTIRWAWNNDISVYTSAPQPDGLLSHYLITPKTLYNYHPWGIRIPEEDTVEPPNLDWIIVPGIAFDECGARLGFGKGYYDRLLTQHSESHMIGIAFNEQISPHPLPQETHDISLHTIITSTRTINAKTPPGGDDFDSNSL